MPTDEVEQLRAEVIRPLQEALARIEAHLIAKDLHAAGMDMIEFVQLTELHAQTLLAMAQQLSGQFPKIKP